MSVTQSRIVQSFLREEEEEEFKFREMCHRRTKLTMIVHAHAMDVEVILVCLL